MKKLKSLFLFSLLALSLTSCDFLGGGGEGGGDEGEADFTLYTLQLTCNRTEDVFLNQRAELNPDAAYDEEEMDYLVSEYGNKGLTKESLQKVGTKEGDHYFFMDQDPIYLYSPQVTGYRFLGWFDGANRIDGGTDLNFDGKSEMINMPNKNAVLEARYELIDYNLLYATGGSLFDTNPINPVTYNVEMDDITLIDASKEGATFKGWSFIDRIFDVSEGKTGIDAPLQEIKNVTKIDKDFIALLGDDAYGYNDVCEIKLYAEFETIKYDVTINWDNDVDASFFVLKNNSDLFDGYHFISQAIANNVEGASNPLVISCESGDKIEIYYSLAELNYEWNGYVEGETTLEESTSYSFTVTKDRNITCKISFISPTPVV